MSKEVFVYSNGPVDCWSAKYWMLLRSSNDRTSLLVVKNDRNANGELQLIQLELNSRLLGYQERDISEGF